MEENKKKMVIKKETKNKLMIAAASICLLTGLYGVNLVRTDNELGNKEGLVELLSAKFNLDQDEAESVLAEYRKKNKKERQMKMKIRLKKRLSKAVATGKITNKQKKIILVKRKEIENKINQDAENWSENREARRETMESYRKEVKQWAESKGIDIRLVGLS